jgi:hypothetical protein
VVAVRLDQLARSGFCLCGCGEKTKGGRYFYPSHDSEAVWAVMKDLYGEREPSAAFLYPARIQPGWPECWAHSPAARVTGQRPASHSANQAHSASFPGGPDG